MKIQFLLFSDGASHKLLGINPVRGLCNLGIEAELFWVKYSKGKLIEKPDYVFCLKPRESDDLVLSFKNKGSKICLIVNDEYLSKDRWRIYDFAVSPSKKWQSTYPLTTYLVKEEFDFCQWKKHKPGLKIVTFGYKENLVNHLSLVLPSLSGQDLTIISNFDDCFRLPDVFYNFCLKQFKAPLDVSDENYDEILIRQFEEYDIGLVTQYDDCGRTSNRIKAFLYAGLPVITSSTNNNENLWFNKDKIKLSLVDEDEWRKKIDELSDYNTRQVVEDFNFEIIQRNYGIEQSARSFLNAIRQYETKEKI
jgi:hypothetical protein